MTPDLQAKVDEIRERAKSHRAMDRMDRTMYASGVIDAMLADIDTLLAALDAERAAVVAWLRSEAVRERETMDELAADIELNAAADAIERGEHREGRDA